MINIEKNNGIQILRASLFIGIIAFHCEIPASQFLWSAVEIFFVISSYFLSKKLIHNRNFSVIKLFKNRLIRLYPDYIFILLFAVGVFVVLNHFFPIIDIIIHFLFLQNFNWMINGYHSDLVFLTAHTWTLSVEVSLFLIWLIAFKFLKSKKQFISFNIIMLIIAILYRIITVVIINDAMFTSLCPIAHADSFAIGSLIAIFEKIEYKYKKHLFISLSCLGLICILISFLITSQIYNVSLWRGYTLYKTSTNYLNNLFTSNIYLFISLSSTGLLYFFNQHQVKNNFLINEIIKLGDISYTGYLIHWPIKVVIAHVIKNNWICFFLVVLFSILGCYILNKLFKIIPELIRKLCYNRRCLF